MCAYISNYTYTCSYNVIGMNICMYICLCYLTFAEDAKGVVFGMGAELALQVPGHIECSVWLRSVLVDDWC